MPSSFSRAQSLEIANPDSHQPKENIFFVTLKTEQKQFLKFDKQMFDFYKRNDLWK